jgi:hypothetical protein
MGSPSLSRRPGIRSVLVLAAAAALALSQPARAAVSLDECPSDPYEAAESVGADTAYYWNDVLLDVFAEEGGGPGPLARAAAMTHVGIFDVLNSAYWSRLEDTSTSSPTTEICGWEPYIVIAETTPSVDADLAAGFAARNILRSTFPQHASLINAAFTTRHGTGFDPEAHQLGTLVADAVIAARADDGSDDTTPYTPDGVPGAWRPTYDPDLDDDCEPVTPHWALVTPFTMTSGDQFRPDFPGLFSTYSGLLESLLYADQFNEVKDLGAVDSTTRTADQTEAAWFWANDLDGTYKPPGQLLEHTRIVAELQEEAETSGDAEDFPLRWSQQGVRVARLFAEVSLAMADAGIAAWDSKYQTDIDLWRPVTAIREADTDNNPYTTEEPSWEPLSATEEDEPFSPCFPAWISGHATFAGAWAQTLENEFASPVVWEDPFPVSLTTDDPHAENVEREFDSFLEAAEENARSRIYLGVHYQFDADDGLDTGSAVADHLTDNYLRWNQTCANWGCIEPARESPQLESPANESTIGGNETFAYQTLGLGWNRVQFATDDGFATTSIVCDSGWWFTGFDDYIYWDHPGPIWASDVECPLDTGTYYWRVQWGDAGYPADDEGPYSQVWSVTVPD